MATVFVIAVPDHTGRSKWGEEHEIVRGGPMTETLDLDGAVHWGALGGINSIRLSILDPKGRRWRPPAVWRFL